jgi:hypothetical protein
MKHLGIRVVAGAIAAVAALIATEPTATAARVRTTPAAPSNLSAASTSSVQVKLTWKDNSSNEAVFLVEIASAYAGPWSRVGIVSANTTSYTKSNLTSGSTYYFRVRASNRTGASPYSNTASASTSASLPAAPSSLTAAPASTSQINLAWTDNSADEIGFDIETSSSSSGPWSTVASVGAGVKSYAVIGLAPASTYYYRAHAKNAVGDSPYSNVASATTQSSSTPPPPVVNGTRPKGIYMLDDKSSPYRTGSMRQADKPFIDGFTWRMPWKSFDTGTTGPSYNFASVDTAVSSLQGLSNNRNNRMKLTLALFVQEVPQYVLNSASATYTADLLGDGGTAQTVLPWDTAAQGHLRNFVHALAEHKVYDSVSGSYIAFRDHPALGQIDAGVLGMQSYRDISGVNVLANSSYTREKLVAAVVACIRIVRDEFPSKFVYCGFFSMKDDTRSPSLDSEVLAAVNSEFDGANKPHIGFFQELLRGDAPNPNGDYGKNLQTGFANGQYVMFQACSPWINKSLCTFTPGDDTPENGLLHGYNNYGALYFEMYAADLANTPWQSMFQEWHDFLQAQP